MSRWCREAGLRFNVHQLQSDCFAFYVRMPGMWNGIRSIFHMHKGACDGRCEPNCDGYNEHAAAAILFINEWAKSAIGSCKPIRRKSFDEVIADIAAGMQPAKKRR